MQASWFAELQRNGSRWPGSPFAPSARSPLLALLLLGLGAWLLVAAPTDGQTGEPAGSSAHAPVHEVHVDGVGVLERTAVRVKVEKGDTLGSISLRHLGTARRHTEIQRLNPKLDPKALRVGQTVVLPPRTATGWVDLFAAVPGGIAQPVGLGAPALLPWGPVTIFAVPHARVEALRALDRDRQLTEPFLRADAQVGRSAAFEPEGSTGQGLARVLTKVRVTAQRGSDLDVMVLDQHLLSSTGQRVAPAAGGAGGAGGRGMLVPLVLVCAGLLVFALIALTARRLGGIPHDRPTPL